jgi:transposase
MLESCQAYPGGSAMNELLERWKLDERQVRDRMYGAPTARERERWHAVWLVARGWSAARAAEALERDAHTVGEWLAQFPEHGTGSLSFTQTGGPPALDATQQAQVKAAVQQTPRDVGLDLGDWNWKGVRKFVGERFGLTLGRSGCLKYLHRLGFVLKCPKKRLLKASPERRAVFVREYALLRATAAATKIFFADEAHFYADVDLRGKWVPKGAPALVDSTSPRYGEKASYYSAVCLETGEVEAMELYGNSCAETSVTFLQQLRANHAGPLVVIWDNGPDHGSDAVRVYFATPDLRLRLVRLPAYSPDFNPDEAIWGWIREEITATTCFGTRAKVQNYVCQFFRDIIHRTDEVKRRCRRSLQVQAEALVPLIDAILQQPEHTDPTVALV